MFLSHSNFNTFCNKINNPEEPITLLAPDTIKGEIENLIDTVNNNLSVPLNLELNYTPTVPNTALDNSATLYIIGLILLLSGLGIFYTSAKKN